MKAIVHGMLAPCAFGALVACTSGEPDRDLDSNTVLAERAPAVTAVYECDEGFEFVARVEGEAAWVFLPTGTFQLLHVPSASGARYEAAGITFWSKGEEATVEAEGVAATDCVNNRRRAVWEHAKLEGVDFRAVGNEPGWHLELRFGATSQLVTDYGSTTLTFQASEPEEDRGARRTTFRGAAGATAIVIVLDRNRCSDTMSGEEFETTVTVTVGEARLRGCGRALH